jgi:hypothetical protein
MTTKRISVAIAGLTATALFAAAPSLASPNKKKQDPQVYLQIKLDTVYVSSVSLG